MSYQHIFLQSIFLYPIFDANLKSFTLNGLENLANLDGPVIFVANHNSHADTVAILRALPNRLKERLVIAAAEDYFYRNRFLGNCVSALLNIFPFDRYNVRKSLSDSQRLLEEGNSMLIYPEGSRDLRKKSFKRGFAILAAECNLPVVPIHICGTAEMLPKGQKYPTAQHVTVSFGEPVYVSRKTTKSSVVTIEHAIRSMQKPA